MIDIKKYFQRLASAGFVLFGAHVVHAPSFLTMDQFYDGTYNGQTILRDSVARAIGLCYEIQSLSPAKRQARQMDLPYLLDAMNQTEPKIWSDVRSGSYDTGFFKEWTKMIASLATKSKFPYQKNSKPFILAYSNKIEANPLLLVAFPGVQFCVEDTVTIIKFFKKMARDKDEAAKGVSAAAGFTDAAQSAINNRLFIMMSDMAKVAGKELKDVQVVFSGHSLGGAVASLAALKYVDKHLNSKNPDNQVLVLTLGQPKTVEKGYEREYDAIIRSDNYRRLVTLPKNWREVRNGVESAKDPVAGYRAIRDADPDSVQCCHAGTRLLLETEIVLQHPPRESEIVFPNIFLGLVVNATWQIVDFFKSLERLVLHPSEVYIQAMKQKPKKSYALQLTSGVASDTATSVPASQSLEDQFAAKIAAFDARFSALEKSMSTLAGLNLDARVKMLESKSTTVQNTTSTPINASVSELQAKLEKLETQLKGLAAAHNGHFHHAGRQPTGGPTDCYRL